jgi:hypothetical protein
MLLKARKADWFASLCNSMALVVFLVSFFSSTVASAGTIQSHPEGVSTDTVSSTVLSSLESKIVIQRLVDYGVPDGIAKWKVNSMSKADLHRVATASDRVAAGGESDSILGDLLLYGVVFVAMVYLVLKATNGLNGM